MEIKYSDNIKWFYMDKSIHIINNISKNVLTLKGQELDFWLEIDKNQTYSIILLNLYSQIDLSKDEIKRMFDQFLTKMANLDILYKIKF